MAFALPLILLAADLSGATAAPVSGGRAVAQARVEIVEPVTNTPRAAPHMPVRQVSQTRDGRWLVEFQ